jgi:glucose/mannose-6-phosphate isomerase
MDLDNIASFNELDVSKMISHIHNLPCQLEQAWELGEKFDIHQIGAVDSVLICGTGSSATAAELIKSYLAPFCPVAITVCKDYQIPAWAKTPQTLILVSGFTGEEGELLAAFTSGLNQGCQLVAISTGGSLISMAKAAYKPYLVFDFSGPSRAALGFEFVLPLMVLFKAGLIRSPREEIFSAAAIMKKLMKPIDINSPVVQNPAKRMAGQFYNRWISLFAAGCLIPVAERWKSQIHENAKAWAQVENISTVKHSTSGGILNPESHLVQMMTLFLNSPNNIPADLSGLEAARRLFMVEGFNTDFYTAEGSSILENMWAAIQFGDYISYYLAMAYGIDPTPVPGVEEMQSSLL